MEKLFMNQDADKRYRVTRRKDIERLFSRGRRASDRMITLLAMANEEPSGRTRAGVAVSKKHGNAVRRNRVKRLCREAFRLTRCELPGGWDFMIIPRIRKDISVQELQASIRTLAARLTEPASQEASQ